MFHDIMVHMTTTCGLHAWDTTRFVATDNLYTEHDH